MRIAIAALLTALLSLVTGCGGSNDATPVSPTPDRVSTAIERTSIGGVALGAAKDSTERLLGAPSARTSEDIGIPIEEVTYATHGIKVMYGQLEEGGPFTVIGVSTDDARYRTTGGVGVGSPASAVAAEPGADCIDPTVCVIGVTVDSPGVVFELRDGKVGVIGVTTND